MRINPIPVFKAQFRDKQFYIEAVNEAAKFNRFDEYEDAKKSIEQSFPYGTISRYSYEDRDVFRIVPKDPIEITIPGKEQGKAKHLDSLIGLGKILKQISPDNDC